MWSSLPSPSPHEAERRRWLSQAHLLARKHHPVQKFSTHSLLLLIDIELAFCAGAWLSVVVLSHASVEATLRQVAKEDYSTSAAALFGKDPEMQWLRVLRNEVLHAAEPGTPSQVCYFSVGAAMKATHNPAVQRTLRDKAAHRR